MESTSANYSNTNPPADSDHPALSNYPSYPGTLSSSADHHAAAKYDRSLNPRRSAVGSRVDRIPDSIRNHVVATTGEFVGTFLFLFFSFAGAILSNNVVPGPTAPNNPAAFIYVSLGFGASLAVNVAFALLLLGVIGPLRAVLVIIAQLVGGIAAAGVASAIFPTSLAVGTRLINGTSIAQGLFIEMFLTAQLVLTILMLAVEKHTATFMAPLGIGLAFFLAELTGIPFTGGSLNPARSLGPDVINRSFPGYHWIYWLGPAMGTVIAVGWYLFLRAFQFQTCNPGQDADHEEVVVMHTDRDMMTGTGAGAQSRV
ncbi:aquaporin [Histoplasma capsulatum var. duboisii H88]|uniref:Aquaporin n=2 Tax=Ajellomyces capsulatus TaxID=5037 RepID=F0UNK5_AJEC8|nr:aquaporin [Histoplasma capsulatum H143]EGC47610.1 aquaporin [Histoplasma capsulatum var. duboisii H88]